MDVFSFIFILSTVGTSTANIYAATPKGLAIFDERESWSFKESDYYGLSPAPNVFSNGSDVFVGGYAWKGANVYISHDNGKSWVTSEVIHTLPHGQATFNFGVTSFHDNIYTSIGQCSGCGVFVSKDNGSLWKKIDQFGQTLSGFYVYNTTIYTMNSSVMAPWPRNIAQSMDGDYWYPVDWNVSDVALPLLITDDSYIYASNVIWDYKQDVVLGLGLSKDNGATWDYKNRSELINCSNCDMSHFQITSISGKRNYVFLATNMGLAISQDNGDTWTTQFSGQMVRDVLTTNHRLYAALNGGLMVSDDWGTTWTSTGLTNTDVYQISFTDFPTCGLYYGLNRQWIAMSQDHGNTWKKSKCGDIDRDLRLNSLAFTRSEIYASYVGGGLYVSEDGGQSWISKSQLVNQFAPDMSSGPIAWITDFSVHNDNLCITGQTTLACSDDAGTTMKKFLDGRFFSIFVTDKTICAISNVSAVLSNDFGGTWNSTPLPVQKYFIHDTEFADGKIYSINLAILNDSAGLGYEVELYRSKDWGATWEMFKITSRHFPGKNITIDPNDYWGKYNFIAKLDQRIRFGYVETSGESEINHAILGNPDIYYPTYHIVGLSIYANNGITYVGFPHGELYISKDDGEHWSLMHVFENMDITSIYVSTVLYIVTKPAYNDRPYSMFISYDNGQTWNNVSNKIAFGLDDLFEAGPISASMECSYFDTNGSSTSTTSTTTTNTTKIPPQQPGFTEWYLILIGCIAFLIIIALLICGYRYFVIKERMKRTERIDGSQLSLVKKLGNGEFGEVWLAKYKLEKIKKICLVKYKKGQTKEMEVALKLSKHHQNGQSDLNLIQADCFYQETIALNVLRHNNIISIIGSCTILKDQYGRTTSALVLEFMNGGSVTDYMQAQQKNLKEQDMIKILLDICQAGKHLSKMGVIHRDIGARNVLIRMIESTGRPMIAKLTDFGLAKDMGMLSKYYKTTNPERTVFHMRYTAPEGFRGQFSSKSDVWSFGVFMWELYMMMGDEHQDGGPVPFAQFSSQVRILQELKNGHRLQRPPAASTEIYAIMEKCWSFEPEPRPTFQELIKDLKTQRDKSPPTSHPEPDVIEHEPGLPTGIDNYGYELQEVGEEKEPNIDSASAYARPGIMNPNVCDL